MESKNIESTYEGIQQNEQIELQQQMISNLKKQLQDKDKKITKLMTENQKLKIVQLPVENQHSKMTHQENNLSINIRANVVPTNTNRIHRSHIEDASK